MTGHRSIQKKGKSSRFSQPVLDEYFASGWLLIATDRDQNERARLSLFDDGDEQKKDDSSGGG